MAVEVCEVVNPIGPANSIVAEASRANVDEVSAADMTQGGCANATAAKMHAAEMTAPTVATTTTVAAAAAACKGVGREAQRANCDARQEHSCCLGHHDFSPDIGPRVCTRRSFTRIYVCAWKRLQPDCPA
jgi:hypothetical protein